MFRSALLALALVSPALGLDGKVVGIVDGDTIDVLDAEKKQHRIRIHGIDTPERGQPFGSKAKAALGDLVFGKTVTVEVGKKDKYDRSVGRVYVAGKDVGLAMIEAGMAWHYAKYDQSDSYSSGQRAARNAKRGLWQDSAPVAPWDWRKMPKTERKRLQELISTESE